MLKVQSVSYKQNPTLWQTLLSRDAMQYPLGYPHDQDYSMAYAEGIRFDDRSLIVENEGTPLAGLQLTIHQLKDQSSRMGFYGRPAFLRLNQDADPTLREKAERVLAEAYMELHEKEKYPQLDFQEMCQDGNLSEFSISLLKEGAVARPLYKQIIDLGNSDDALKRDLRKSYKSLINWGDKNLQIELHDSSNIKQSAVENFRQLHISVAGRETRNALSWDCQYKQILNNEAFMITGRLDGKLVTAALFLHSQRYCFYGVSASNRDMFDKPLSHAIIWHGVNKARDIGCRFFEMGDLAHLYPQGFSEKEKNIAVFKRGFGGKAHLGLMIGFAP